MVYEDSMQVGCAEVLCGDKYFVHYRNQWGEMIPVGECSTKRRAMSLARRYRDGRDRDQEAMWSSLTGEERTGCLRNG